MYFRLECGPGLVLITNQKNLSLIGRKIRAPKQRKKFAEHGSEKKKKKTLIEAPIIDSVGFSGVVIYDSCYRVESGACQDKLWQISSKTMPQQINY